jgi:hypothetical protein
MAKKLGRTIMWVVGGIGLALAFTAAKLASRVVEDNDADDIDDGPAPIVFKMNEGRYPPFSDTEITGIKVESEGAEKQAIIIGVDQREFDANRNQEHTLLALARCDTNSLWRPAVAKTGQLVPFSEGNEELYVCAMYLTPGSMHLTLGFMTKEQFTPCKSTKIIALTTKEGLLYDYPNVPIIEVTGVEA